LQVCGTPASGKSTLAKLLGRYIKDREPAIDLIWISGWTFTDVEATGGWERYLKYKRHWVEDKKTVFIFDEAQTSYADGALWNDFFKCIHDYPNRRAIAFVSFGSTSSIFFIKGIPIFVAGEARITMLPIAHDGLGAVVRRAVPAVSVPRVPLSSLLPPDYIPHHPGTRRSNV
jgi:predicted AAA+ superfamily ATPase